MKDIKVEVGDRVTVGQVLAELDKDNLSARLREARAALAGAEANVTAAGAEFEKNKVEAEGPDVPFARRNLERAEKLFTDKLVPQQTLDDTRSALEMAVNRQQAARTRQLGVAQARMAQALGVGRRRAGRRRTRRRGAAPTPPSGRPSTAWSSRARSNSAARCRPSSISVRTRRW